MTSKPLRVVLVSGHYVGSKRRAGFHWIADAFRASGWDVTFVTVGFSQLSRLKADHRFGYGLTSRANRLEEVEPGLHSYAWFTPFHPLHRLPPPIQLAAWPVFATYGKLRMPGLRAAVETANLVLFESTAGLMLVPRFRRWNREARFVYRVSDDLRTLRAHRVVLRAERDTLSEFALVSVPSDVMLERFADHPNARRHYHGLDTDRFDTLSLDPYASGSGTRAVYVGTAYFDRRFLEMASGALPDWQFHVIGPIGDLPDAPNAHGHGELAFDETVPFITHADVGLACRTQVEGVESFSDSLKVIQYTYARLPIVAPEFVRSWRRNVFAYRPGDPASIREALVTARSMDRSTVDRSGIGSWSDLARELAGADLWSSVGGG